MKFLIVATFVALWCFVVSQQIGAENANATVAGNQTAPGVPIVDQGNKTTLDNSSVPQPALEPQQSPQSAGAATPQKPVRLVRDSYQKQHHESQHNTKSKSM
ncbi:uncharacterized protein [Onthophagus taurus]|uniref:uncharacterized protein n=1 Tax=Onthophagus taurus TaxID=166361 RepID=UPI0039BE9E86